MTTDGLLYALFETLPGLFFDLIGQPSMAGDYRFAYIAGEHPDGQLDGMFLPRDCCLIEDPTYYFVKARLQWDPMVYRDLFSEIFLYLEADLTVTRWQAVVLFPNAELEVDETQAFGAFFNTSHVQVIYLNQLGAISELSLGLSILRLLVEPAETLFETARRLIECVQVSAYPATTIAQLITVIEAIVVYLLLHHSHGEVSARLSVYPSERT